MEYDEGAEERLKRINASRRFIARPLLDYYKAASQEETALGQARAFAALLEKLKLGRAWSGAPWSLWKRAGRRRRRSTGSSGT